VTLRRRLVLTVVLAAVPLVGLLVWIRGELMERAGEESLRELLVGRMEAGGRERCEQDPASVGEELFRPRTPLLEGHPRHRHVRRRPLAVYAYDFDLRPASRLAPALPEELRRQLAAGADAASLRKGGELHVVARMPWDEGPCAVLVAVRGESERERPEVAPGWLLSAIVLCGGFAAAVWLAAGPVVRRIHELAEGVRRSAASRYAEPVSTRGSDEVAALARAFNEAGEEVRTHLTAVEKRERTLRDFVANTTHDVMLPLSVLLGQLSGMRDRARKGEVDGALVESAIEEAQYLSSLVHNLSAAAKLETGELLVERHRFDLADLVSRVVERHRALAGARHVEMNHAVPEAPVEVEGDVTLLEQAVGNLVSNAVRHNREGGHVAVVLEEDGPGRFRLRVEDDGPGVPADALPRLGERRFRTEEARQRHPEGRGLGLAIVRDVAARHGFTLTFAPGDPSGLRAEVRGPAL
jgi:signal transduction histidine kinase